ncbi:MAG: phosphoribosylanthranilate isomerase [Gemmatimonadetes bacterium]|nr:MAG: phosphoribosylanthranilate isomerase [Gemmatimonadota bacterium]
MTRIKICCISSPHEAGVALAAGADALGLVSAMPSGPGVLGEDRIAGILAGLPDGTDTFLLTSKRRAADIVAQHLRCPTSTIQICDELTETDAFSRLRGALSGVTLVQVVHVEGPEAVERALAVAEQVDALLLDSGRPAAPTPQLGGTGRTHDWRWSRRIVEQSPVPVYLAGGLDAGNVRRALDEVGPYGVDVCSGVRRDGALAPDRLESFVAAVRAA